jgi:hypothetical protein
MKRQAKLTIRNKQLLRAKVGQQIVMGVLAGTLFYQMDLAKAPARRSLASARRPLPRPPPASSRRLRGVPIGTHGAGAGRAAAASGGSDRLQASAVPGQMWQG